MEQFALQVAALCRDNEPISALGHLAISEQIMQAEDDLEEWQAAEQYLGHWRAVEADLPHASTACSAPPSFPESCVVSNH
jgi:hypothetical protein